MTWALAVVGAGLVLFAVAFAVSRTRLERAEVELALARLERDGLRRRCESLEAERDGLERERQRLRDTGVAASGTLARLRARCASLEADARLGGAVREALAACGYDPVPGDGDIPGEVARLAGDVDRLMAENRELRGFRDRSLAAAARLRGAVADWLEGTTGGP